MSERTVTRAEFRSNARAIMERAAAEGPITVLNDDGRPSCVIHCPRDPLPPAPAALGRVAYEAWRNVDPRGEALFPPWDMAHESIRARWIRIAEAVVRAAEGADE